MVPSPHIFVGRSDGQATALPLGSLLEVAGEICREVERSSGFDAPGEGAEVAVCTVHLWVRLAPDAPPHAARDDVAALGPAAPLPLRSGGEACPGVVSVVLREAPADPRRPGGDLNVRDPITKIAAPLVIYRLPSCRAGPGWSGSPVYCRSGKTGLKLLGPHVGSSAAAVGGRQGRVGYAKV